MSFIFINLKVFLLSLTLMKLHRTLFFHSDGIYASAKEKGKNVTNTTKNIVMHLVLLLGECHNLWFLRSLLNNLLLRSMLTQTGQQFAESFPSLSHQRFSVGLDFPIKFIYGLESTHTNYYTDGRLG